MEKKKKSFKSFYGEYMTGKCMTACRCAMINTFFNKTVMLLLIDILLGDLAVVLRSLEKVLVTHMRISFTINATCH